MISYDLIQYTILYNKKEICVLDIEPKKINGSMVGEREREREGKGRKSKPVSATMKIVGFVFLSLGPLCRLWEC